MIGLWTGKNQQKTFDHSWNSGETFLQDILVVRTCLAQLICTIQTDLTFLMKLLVYWAQLLVYYQV